MRIYEQIRKLRLNKENEIHLKYMLKTKPLVLKNKVYKHFFYVNVRQEKQGFCFYHFIIL